MTLRLYIPAVLLMAAAVGAAQPDSVQVTRDFQFTDGVYLAFEDFQANRPSLSWDEVDAQLVTSRQAFMAQAEYIRKKDGSFLPSDSIWGICLKGTPYILLPDTATSKQVMVFAGLRVRGRICYYTYEAEESRTIEMAAYNPLTGRPFRKGAISREETVVRKRMLHFQDGRREVFSKEAFLDWITDDPQLWRTVDELSDKEAEEKLYKCLLIYDDRNPAYVPVKN
ncbi:MAG: hypothetical protein KDD06_29155 [Phaeodactylibacter sp.]|nr:hypothetical protein [Phaeodactylibacter sp.]